MKVAAMLKESLPGCEVGLSFLLADIPTSLTAVLEKASIDEVFIDFTKALRDVLVQRYPYIAQVPVDASDGVDTPLPPPPTIQEGVVGNLISINPPPSKEEIDEKEIIDHEEKGENPGGNSAVDMWKEKFEAEELPTTWHDVALSIAAEMMQKARDDVRIKLGYSTSAVSYWQLFPLNCLY